ncbi:MAG TPA: hypothetical protein DCY38_06940 [Opitutae bacterium]|nr:hypothetical protein [Opitutae bacterium]
MKLTSFVLFVALMQSVHGECKIIAHRGASNRTPENTVLSVQTAWDLGADAVEIDLRLTLDKKIVAYHDKDTERIGGRKELVEKQTLLQLKELDVGMHRGAKFSALRIPTLSEIIETVPNDRSVFLELKSGPEILPILKNELAKSTLAKKQIKIIGFEHDTIAEAKALFPEAEIYWLVGISQNRPYTEWPRAITEVLNAAEKGNFDGLCVKGNAVVTSKFVSQAQMRGLKFFVYTINSKIAANRFKQMGVDGIITDRPKFIRDNIN